MNICLDKIRQFWTAKLLLIIFIALPLWSQGQTAADMKQKLNAKQQKALDEQKAKLAKAKFIKEKYGKIDSYALAAPANVTADAKLLAAYLSIAPPCVTREEKLRAIYTWMTTNIQFDWYMWAYENELGPKAIPDTSRSMVKWRLFKLRMSDKKYKKFSSNNAILKDRKASLKGYAQLFNYMCYEAGLKSMEITGYKKDDLWERGDLIYRTNHKWNAVFLGKKWYFVDVVNKFWILDQDIMQKTMIPAEPMWQMTKKPISMNGFIMEKTDYYSENYNYVDSIKTLNRLNPQKKKIARAKMIHRFNPDNYSAIAYAYLDVSKDMYFVAKSPKTGMKRAKEGFTLAAKNFKIASGYLKSIKKTELKPVSKLILNRNKAMNKEKMGEFKVKLKEVEAEKKVGPPESTLEADLAEVNAEYTDKIATLEEELIEKTDEAGNHVAMVKLISRQYARIIDSTKKAQKAEIAKLEYEDKMRIENFENKLQARKDSIDDADHEEDNRFTRIKKTTKKKIGNDIKKNAKDTAYAKSMSKKAKTEAKKMKGSIKKVEKGIKEDAKKQAAKDKEAAKKEAAKQKELDAKIKEKQKED